MMPKDSQLIDFFKKLGIDTRGIRVEKSWRTPTKTRILAGAVHAQRQQIVRLDSGGPAQARSPNSARSLPACDALLVSDYGYGAITPEVRQPDSPQWYPCHDRFAVLDRSLRGHDGSNAQ